MDEFIASLSPGKLVRRSDILFTFALIAVLVILILPMPTWLLDISLSISISLSVIILVNTLFIERPLDFNSFPMVLLIATIFRLALNVASTRIILSNGHQGLGAAGHIIQAFGKFIMGGNFVIGLIVFAILMIINFMVITKGSGRIAEVSARFSLDAMPGKQMAIDADLAAGAINDEEAKIRRKEVEDESNFYGAMDGAAKFVRGDAVAGLLIIFINIIGGILIGVLQQKLSVAQAAATYTFLTVGDGLVSQIPGLIVSVAAGMIISKGNTKGSADKALVKQLSAYPVGLLLCSILLFGFSFIPGIPFLPFFFVSAVIAVFSWVAYNNKKHALDEIAEKRKKQEQLDATLDRTNIPTTQEKISHMDMLRIEISYNLLSLLNDSNGLRITDQIKNIRDQLGLDLGFVMPSVRVVDNYSLPENTYVIKIKEIEVCKGTVYPDKYLVMSPDNLYISIPGDDTREPAFGLPAKWIQGTYKYQAEQQGLTVVEPATVITTHLIEIVKDNIADLLTFSDVQALVENLSEGHRKLVNDMVPTQLSMGTIQRILQNLLSERISIRDLPTILEAISESGLGAKAITPLTEYVRSRLARQISSAFATEGTLNILTLSPDWEQDFASSLVGDSSSVRELAMPPSQIRQFISQANKLYERPEVSSYAPVLVTSPNIRPFVQALLDRLGPKIPVLSQNEVHPRMHVETVGEI